ncbi:FecR family protein [Spirosoma luteolum]
MEKDYRSYSANDFALDASFRDWVLNPETTEAPFWAAWLARHPDRAAEAEQARLLLLTLHQRYRDDLTDDVVRHDLSRLMAQVTQPVAPVRPLWAGRAGWWRVAAAVLLLLGAAWWLVPARTVQRPAEAAAAGRPRMLVRTNTTSHPMTMLLNDGSVVTLERNSTLTFPDRFAGTTRPVSLVGEAFFDIAKNPARPFLVFTRESVTRVVGTSFRIRATAGAPTVQVAVRTGRVAVYTRTAFAQAARQQAVGTGEVVLRPREQAVLTRTSGRLEKQPVTDARAAAETIRPAEVSFDDQPVVAVFRQLSHTYGIDLRFDEQKLANCRITTAFIDETLPERLSAICQAINATYQTTGDQISISAKGCE